MRLSLDIISILLYCRRMKTKEQNAVSTTWEQNMAAAKVCETMNEAISLFRALQYANDMGTHGGHFDELEEHFIAKQGLKSYLENGFTVAQASNI